MITGSARLIGWRALPVVLLSLAIGLWFNDVQDGGPYVLRNLMPLLILNALALLALIRGHGRWAGAGYSLPLAALGFAIPALGLAAYLHYAYEVNLDGMFSGEVSPGRVFRYLPYYTVVAGGIGYLIGWIVGRNL